MELDLPHTSQDEVLRQRARFNVLSAGRRWGKSVIAINLLIEAALLGKKCGYFGPTYKLINEVYRELKQRIEGAIIQSNDQEKRIELLSGGVIECWSLQRRDSGRGRKYHLVVVDEAAFVKDLKECWTEAIRPTLTDYKGDAWFLSTPKGKNYFYHLFLKGKDGDLNWASFQKTTYDNPAMDKEEIDDAGRELPELAFSQEYLAEFNDNVACPFGHDKIEHCVGDMSTEPAVVYAADLAKSHDWTVIIGLDRNGAVCHFERFQKDWRQTKNILLNLPVHVPLWLDSTGVGDPICEEIAGERTRVHLFKFTSQSKQQLMEGLASAIHQHKLIFPDGLIREELENFEYEYTRGGVKYSAPSGLHDDCVCALALAWMGLAKSHRPGNYSFI